jgi:hypothetical protein
MSIIKLSEPCETSAVLVITSVMLVITGLNNMIMMAVDTALSYCNGNLMLKNGVIAGM